MRPSGGMAHSQDLAFRVGHSTPARCVEICTSCEGKRKDIDPLQVSFFTLPHTCSFANGLMGMQGKDLHFFCPMALRLQLLRHSESQVFRPATFVFFFPSRVVLCALRRIRADQGQRAGRPLQRGIRAGDVLQPGATDGKRSSDGKTPRGVFRFWSGKS